MLFGRIVGSLANKKDLKRALIVYWITCILSCITTKLPQNRSTITGCILGGIIVSLLSAFDSWLAANHMYIAPSLDNILELEEVVDPDFLIGNNIMSHRVDQININPGDHIYSWRTAFAYSHHGLFFYLLSLLALTIFSILSLFITMLSVYVVYFASNSCPLFLNYKSISSYTQTSLLGRERTGSSGQVSSWVNVPLAVAVYILLNNSFWAAITVRCLNHYMTDIGVRDDMVRIKAEDVISLHFV
uniref:Putative molybdate-anion transporter n=1 Tax=Helianthus annuus TaxID=4232 RepID=A0A251VBV3_HELAN